MQETGGRREVIPDVVAWILCTVHSSVHCNLTSLQSGAGEERDMQLIALEQLCMLLLMSDNVDRSVQCRGKGSAVRLQFNVRALLCCEMKVQCCAMQGQYCALYHGLATFTEVSIVDVHHAP